MVFPMMPHTGIISPGQYYQEQISLTNQSGGIQTSVSGWSANVLTTWPSAHSDQMNELGSMKVFGSCHCLF